MEDELMAGKFYIVDVRDKFRRNPYITLWRPDDAGYAYPLPWAGQYEPERIDANPNYYYTFRFESTRVLERYPVPCEIVERFGVAPAKGAIDGDAGPVLRNTREVRDALRKHRYVPTSLRSRATLARSDEGAGE